MLTRINPEDIHFYTRLNSNELSYATHYALIPIESEKGWEEVVYLKEPIIDASGGVRATEYVYVLVNSSIPNMVKIGMTTTHPIKRASEISKATGVPTPWVAVWWLKCYASATLEKRVHEYLHQYRISEDREMFGITSTTAQQVIEELGKNFTNILIVDQIKNID